MKAASAPWGRVEEEEEGEGAQHRAESKGMSPAPCDPGTGHPRGASLPREQGDSLVGGGVGPPAWGERDPSHLAALHERSHREHITLVCNKNQGLTSLCLTQSLDQRPLGACFPHGRVHSYLSVCEPAKPLISVMQSHWFQQCWLVGQCCCLGRWGIWGKSSRKEVSGGFATAQMLQAPRGSFPLASTFKGYLFQ